VVSLYLEAGLTSQTAFWKESCFLTLYILVGPFCLSWVTMSPRLFYDKDCSLEQLKGKTVVFIGYGNQGRAQALNLVSYRERIEYPT
jgi:hypothetical protein